MAIFNSYVSHYQRVHDVTIRNVETQNKKGLTIPPLISWASRRFIHQRELQSIGAGLGG